LTRKHFAAIAAELRSQRPDLRGVLGQPTYASSPAWDRGAYDEWATIVIGMASVLAQFNPGFRRDRFLAACGLDA
jgi:hypothetical protein